MGKTRQSREAATTQRRFGWLLPILKLTALAGALGEALEREQQRWFLWLPVAFGTGVALYFWLPGEPSLAAAIAPVPASLILARVWERGGVTRFVTGGLIALSAGMAIAKIRTENLRGPVLERQLRGQQLVGWLELAEPRPRGGQRLTLRVVSLGALTKSQLPVRVRVTTRRANPALIPGDLITIKATIGPPGRPALPGGYDFARHAWYQQLGGIGYSRRRAERAPNPVFGVWELTAPLGLRMSAAIQRLRQRLGRRITKALPGETGAIANALITGERASISDATNEAFRDSGLFHILSISGLHMVIMAGAIFFALRLVLAASPAIALRYSIKKWGALAAALGALAYLAISGGTFATVRSYIMISIMFFAILLDRPAVALRNVALAALVILVLFPESLLNVGFQMSFAAVVSLVAAYEALRDRAAEKPYGQARGPVLSFIVFFGGIIMTTLVASISVAPFAAYHFQASQQYAVLANLIAVPISNIIVMPAALVTFLAMPFGLEAIPLWVMGKGIEGMVWCAKAVAQLPGAVGLLPQIPKSAFLLMVSGGLWLTLWRRRWRLLGIIGIMAGLVLAPGKPLPDVLIGSDGELVAVRISKTMHGYGLRGGGGASPVLRGGVLSALPTRASKYQLGRWLRADGDGRKAAQVATGAGFRCDRSGCTAQVKGKIIAVSRQASGLRDDCAKADIIVALVPVPNWCTEFAGGSPKKIFSGSGIAVQRVVGSASPEQLSRPVPIIIDRSRLRALGTHSIAINAAGKPGAQYTIDWVAAHRGHRPWSIVGRPRR